MARGDPQVWRELYDELAPALLAFLRARGAPEPEDLLGEVMAQIARDVGRFRGDWDALRAWAFRIARNRLIDDRRYRARRPVEPATAEALAASAPHADAELEALDRIGDRAMLVAIRALAPDQRDVLILRFFSRLTVEETARALGKRPGSVKALQRRGLKALRKRLEADFGDGPSG